MAPSRVSGMKMRNLLFGVVLGLLAVVHSTPVNTVTQNPSEAEDDFFREAMTDGFLIDQSLPTLLTTESLPKKQTDGSSSNSSTTQIPQSGVTASPVPNETQTEESNIPDGSGDEHYTTTTQSVSHVQNTTSTVLPRDTDSDSSTTQIPESGFTSSLAVNEAHYTESNIIDGSGDYQTTTTESVSHGQSSTSTLLPRNIYDFISDSSTTQIPQSDFTSSFMLNEAHYTESSVPDGSGDYQTTTTERVSHGQSSTSTLLPRNIYDFISDSSTTQIPQSDFTSSFMLNEAQSTESSIPDGSGDYQTTTTERVSHAQSSTSTLDSESTTMTMTTTRTQNDMIKPRMFGDTNTEKLKATGQANQQNVPAKQNTTNSTPSWIIIVGFIVGVAALVMLCVAIATRDKWNGPSRASQLETNANSSNQQRELEMETFLHKDNPRENGKAAEYTVIPLDELSESYSSH